ncbi:MAG TPA: DMT family transporter [Candidatus Babeliales bacterium]|jgi:drug/metabolite transporter (DMT)-like permease|nr:DMT family transporter [Candidatus Babeliales bacterium]
MTFIILLQALFATSFPMGKYLLNFTSPLFLSGARMLIAGGLLLIYQYFLPSKEFKIKRKHWWIFAQIIILGMYATYGLRLYALKVLPVWKTSFFYNLSPFLSALYAYCLFNERLSKKQWLGLSIGLMGMIPILISSSPEEATLGEFLNISIYEVFLIISVSLHCYSWILIQKLVRYKNYDTSIVNGIGMAAGGLLSLVTSYAIEGPVQISDPATFAKGLIIMIFISNILCHNIYAGLLKKYSATFMSFTSFLSPLFAALYGWVFFQETISWHFYLSIIIVLLGLYIFYQDELKNKSDYEDKEIQI